MDIKKKEKPQIKSSKKDIKNNYPEEKVIKINFKNWFNFRKDNDNSKKK